MFRRVMTAACAVAGLGIVGVSPAEAVGPCGIDPGGMSVQKRPNGDRYISGIGHAFCYAPPPSFNYISVNVHPTNPVIDAIAPAGWSYSGANSCSNGACSITPISWGYTAANNALVNAVNGNKQICFTATYFATYGGQKSRQACG